MCSLFWQKRLTKASIWSADLLHLKEFAVIGRLCRTSREDVMKYSSAELTTSQSSELTAAPRPLTYDEKKAAEAAFRCDAFNPAWSQAALKVYHDISRAMVQLQVRSEMEHASK